MGNSEESRNSRRQFYEPTRLLHLMQHYTELNEKRATSTEPSYAKLYFRLAMVEDRLR
jgi:hypothetical protein